MELQKTTKKWPYVVPLTRSINKFHKTPLIELI